MTMDVFEGYMYKYCCNNHAILKVDEYNYQLNIFNPVTCEYLAESEDGFIIIKL